METLKSLYIKKSKLLDKKQKKNKVISQESKELDEIDLDLSKIENEILNSMFPSLFINFKDLQSILLKYLGKEKVNSILQSCSSYSKATHEISSKSDITYIDCYLCSLDDKLQICQDKEKCQIRNNCSGTHVKIFIKQL